MISPSQRQLGRGLAETLAIAAVGGVSLGLAGIPAGWMSGAIILVAAAALLGRPVIVPNALARVVFVAIGISLGSVVTPETVQGMTAWPLSIVVLAVAMACLIAATSLYLTYMHGWDASSALLAACPGALSQVLVMAHDMRADMRAVAIVQTVRVVILAVGLPSGLALFGLAGPPVQLGGSIAFDSTFIEFIVLIAVSSAVAALLFKLRFPGGLIFGAMITSAFLHGSGLVHVRVPWWIANASMITLGAVTGARFANTSPRMLFGFIGAGLGSFLVAGTVAAIFAFGLTTLTPLREADVVIAFAPGALDAMMILALAMHLDPVYVGAHHLARFAFVSLFLPFAATLLKRRSLPVAEHAQPARKRVTPED